MCVYIYIALLLFISFIHLEFFVKLLLSFIFRRLFLVIVFFYSHFL